MTPMDIDVEEARVDDILNLSPSTDKHAYTILLKQIADQSKENREIRTQLAQPSILHRFVDHISSLPDHQYEQEFETEILRCIGNACAMNANAITTVSSFGFNWFRRYQTLQCPQKLQHLAAAVLYNMTAADFSAEEDDTERENPALKACFMAGIHIYLIQLLVQQQIEVIKIDDLIDMLFWIASSSQAATNRDLPLDAIEQLLHSMPEYCQQLSAEALSTLVESIVTLLRSETIKASIAVQPMNQGLLDLLTSLEERTTRLQAQDDNGTQHTEDLAVLVPQLSNLTWLLSDISAEPAFAKESRLNDPLLSKCLPLLISSTAHTQAQIACCLVIGNGLLNLPESETASVIKNSPVVAKVVELLSQTDASPDLLYAASGLLNVLGRPVSSRSTIGEAEQLVPALHRLCKHVVEQIQQNGVRVVKTLGTGCPANQARFAALMQDLQQTSNKQEADPSNP